MMQMTEQEFNAALQQCYYSGADKVFGIAIEQIDKVLASELVAGESEALVQVIRNWLEQSRLNFWMAVG